MLELAASVARAGSRTGPGVLGLILIGVAALALLAVDRDDRKARWKLAGIGVAGLALLVSAGWTALPPPLPTVDAPVILIDESADTVNGVAGGVYDQASTRHMMRNQVGGSMWAPAGGSPLGYGVGWRVYVVKPARYALEVQYSAETPHPGEVRVDDRTLFTGLAQTTGGRWKPRWFHEGTVDLHAGHNRLAFFGQEGLPWIAALRLTRLAADAHGRSRASP